MIDIKRLVKNYCNHSSVDYIGLWQIAGRVKGESGSNDDVEIRNLSMDVARGLIEVGVEPGDYGHGGFQYWPGTVDERLQRIEANWDSTMGLPTLVEPICWFALRKAG